MRRALLFLDPIQPTETYTAACMILAYGAAAQDKRGAPDGSGPVLHGPRAQARVTPREARARRRVVACLK